MALNLFFFRSFYVPCRTTFNSIGASSVSGLPSTCITSVFLPSAHHRRRLLNRANYLSEIERPISHYFHTSSQKDRDHSLRAPAYPILHPAMALRFDTAKEAEEVLFCLRKSERELLYKILKEHYKQDTGGVAVEDEHFDAKLKSITGEQLKLLFLCNSLPFIGFGILDNLIMILAGEYIDSTLGVFFGLSTMAAAGFGNIISDIAGVGLAHYVEIGVAKFFNVRPPPLTSEQWDSSKARWTSNGARAFGLTIGCLIGMFPLLFYDETAKQERKLQAKLHVHDDAVSKE